jgi:hypothetical protein
MPPTKRRNGSTHCCWDISHGILIDHSWMEIRQPAERRHPARQDGSDGRRVEPAKHVVASREAAG